MRQRQKETETQIQGKRGRTETSGERAGVLTAGGRQRKRKEQGGGGVKRRGRSADTESKTEKGKKRRRGETEVAGRMLGMRIGTGRAAVPTGRWSQPSGQEHGANPAGSHMPPSHPSHTPGRQQLAHWELGQAWP